MRAAEVYSVTGQGAAGIRFEKHPGMTWRDYLVTLLHIAAEVEHGLMVQYLYAAYTLGGPGLDAKETLTVADWQKNILEVAKEEMGHLLTVQNLLALLGAPPNFTRAETAFEEALSPIPFFLEPLTRDVVASFTFAEMSPDLEANLRSAKHLRPGLRAFLKNQQKLEIDLETDELAHDLGSHKVQPQPVALLYEEVIRVLANRELIPDSELDEMSYEAQASWDDWGRGYAPDPKRLTASGDFISQNMKKHRANVLVMRAATRTEALAALRAISGQGEAVHLQHVAKSQDADGSDEAELAEHSHFERFLTIWQHYPTDWKPHRNVMINPATRPSVAKHQHIICDPLILDWALLFNLRYRMLLTFLAHSFRLARVVRPGEPNLRGMVMHRAFGEMYNLKTIAGILVQMRVPDEEAEDYAAALKKIGDRHADRSRPLYAGPPFETPYSLNMPAAHVDVFRLHQDLFTGSVDLIRKIQARGEGPGTAYLGSLLELDKSALEWIRGILRTPAVKERA